MITGIGTDVIETARMKQAVRKHGKRFLEHVFTEYEIRHAPDGAGKDAYFAARWAAKEAVAKALRTGIGAQCAWTDVEIRNGNQGEPLATLSGKAAVTAAGYGVSRIHVSLSHERNIAAAVAVAEKDPETHIPINQEKVAPDD